MDRITQFLGHSTTVMGYGLHNWMLLAMGIVLIWLLVLLPGAKF